MVGGVGDTGSLRDVSGGDGAEAAEGAGSGIDSGDQETGRWRTRRRNVGNRPRPNGPRPAAAPKTARADTRAAPQPGSSSFATSRPGPGSGAAPRPSSGSTHG